MILNPKLLVVDDERGIVDMIQSYFQTQYDILTAYSGQEALKKVACKPDLILLDINMPGMDGLTVCQKIREHIACPILFLTARIESSDKIIGFQAGADDYIVKPFDLDELGARIAAHLRREQRRQNNSAVRFFGELILDYSARTVTINNQNIPLSKREFEIVELLSLNAGQVFDRERIYERVWGLDGDGNSDTIMEHIRKMICLYSGLRREEALGLQWDCVFLDAPTPYISVRRAWRSEHNRPVVSTVLKTPAAKRDIPIPKCLVDCLREAKENSISDYVIADSKGEPLAYSQFQRVWQYVVVRSTKPRNYYKYVNGESIKYTVTPTLGMTQKNQPKIRYTIDFDVTPHQLRHTYITNLLYAGVDPKTVQYLAGHENSKTTMDIYAKVKYNKPEELFEVVNDALHQRVSD